MSSEIPQSEMRTSQLRTSELQRAVAEAASRTAGRELAIEDWLPVGGGSIHSAALVELSDGRRLFVKSNADAPADLFPREAEGLEALAEPGMIRVPRDPVPGKTGRIRFLTMEAIDTGPPPGDFFERFGRSFAELHRQTADDVTPGFEPDPALEHYIGFPHDNYIGSTPQPNAPVEGAEDSWPEFFRRRRLGFQLELARERGLATDELERRGERLLERLEELIEVPGEPPCLLHGDLWSGNFLCSTEGEPVLIDPAVYRGHREADLAMTRLFGGFQPAFYRAYEEVWPLPAGSAERQEVYKLYHLLNHLNLFGVGYLSGCLSILRRFT